MDLHRVTQVNRVTLFRLLAALTAFLLAAWCLELAQEGLFVFWRRTALVLAMGGLALFFLLLFALTWTRQSAPLEKLLDLPLHLVRLKNWNLALFIISVIALAGLYLVPVTGQEMFPEPARTFAFWAFSMLGAFFLSAYKMQSDSYFVGTVWFEGLLVSLLVNGFVYTTISYLGTITAYPYSLNWSEATRYYHASLLFSEALYGFHIPPFYQDFSRYLLEAIPFLFPVQSLLIARAWESFLWVGLNALTAWTLARRFPFLRGRRVEAFLFFAFIFLFIFQGPIYYYLLPCVFLVLWGFDARNFVRSLIAVLLASIWAGFSRINWIPVPAMLALTLYLLEVPVNGRALWKYLLAPAALTAAGLAAAWPSRLWFMTFSEADPAVFNAALDSPLLWYRLLPTSMYDWGVLPTSIVVSVPALAILFLHLRGRWRDWHWIRLAGLGSMLFLLLAGGLIVSTKIGGGANLHNLDGYLTLLTVTLIYFLLDQFAAESTPHADQSPERTLSEHSETKRQSKGEAATLVLSEVEGRAPAFPWLLVFALVAVPLVLAVRTRVPRLPARPVDASAFKTVAALQQVIDESAAQEGEMLFITQRQLLTFGLIQNVPMVGGYDNVDLIEFAIMGYPPGLETFYRDLESHRFKLIIAPYQSRVVSLEGSFAEESYSWYVYISKPLMKYYRVKAEFKDFDFLILEPIP